MSKVRRIDWSPDEWIAGTFGLLTMRQTAVYIVVLMQIYSRGGECPNDATFVARHFRIDEDIGESWRGITRSARASIDSLIKLGKLRLSADGQWLTNGRADIELNKARERISATVRAGLASGKLRRHPADIPSTSRQHGVNSKPKYKSDKDLAPTRVRNHQPSTIISSLSESLTDAAREPAPDQTAPARAPAKRDARLERLAALARAKLMKGE